MTTATKKTAAKKTTTKKTSTVKKEIEPIIDEVIDEIDEEIIEEVVVETVKEAKKFKDTDLVACLCMFPGTVGMTGRRTGNVYLWEDMGVTEYVEYQDLRSEVLNKKSMYIYKPLIIVEDEDFLDQNPTLEKMYKDMYTPDEIISKIRKETPEGMRKFVEALPTGIKDSVKNIASTMMHDGILYDIRKIRILDNIFETDLELYSQLVSHE